MLHDLLQKLTNAQGWCKLFKQKKAYLESLETDLMKLQEEKVKAAATALEYAQRAFEKEKTKLDKYMADRDSLRVWVPENQAKFDEFQVVLSDKVQKTAEKIAKAAKDLPRELGQDQAV
jgi:flagellar motor protein MotB